MRIIYSKPSSGVSNIVRPPFHGREIHAVHLDTDSCGVFSAGEDGQLRFTSIDFSKRRPQLHGSGQKVGLVLFLLRERLDDGTHPLMVVASQIADMDLLAPVRGLACVQCSEENHAIRKIVLMAGARLTLQAVDIRLSSSGLVQATRVVVCPRRMIQSALRSKGDQHRILSMSASFCARRVFVVFGTSLGRQPSSSVMGPFRLKLRIDKACYRSSRQARAFSSRLTRFQINSSC